nr:hypothetical protein Itr_chr14CG31300 [Ipomoea trifida]
MFGGSELGTRRNVNVVDSGEGNMRELRATEDVKVAENWPRATRLRRGYVRKSGLSEMPLDADHVFRSESP